MKPLAPYVRLKDVELAKMYDHEDVEAGFTADSTLLWFVNFLASCGVCVLLLLAIAVVAQVPDSWLSWFVLAIGGL